MPEEEYRHKLDVLAEHCKDFGRDPGDIRKQIGLSVSLGETEAEATDRVREREATSGINEDLLRGRFLATAPTVAPRASVRTRTWGSATS